MDIPAALIKYGVTAKGVIQIGSHHGEEVPIWNQMGIPQVHFEPVRANYMKMMAEFPDLTVFPVALGRYPGVQKMNVETINGGQSCSLLKPKTHLELLPWIQFDRQEQVIVMPLDMFNLRDSYNFIYMDAQGFELEILKGAVETINHGIDVIMTEVNATEVFEGCAIVKDIDHFLWMMGFDRVETNWHGGDFGDALYIRA